jgi:hypothetical protein
MEDRAAEEQVLCPAPIPLDKVVVDSDFLAQVNKDSPVDLIQVMVVNRDPEAELELQEVSIPMVVLERLP